MVTSRRPRGGTLADVCALFGDDVELYCAGCGGAVRLNRGLALAGAGLLALLKAPMRCAGCGAVDSLHARTIADKDRSGAAGSAHGGPAEAFLRPSRAGAPLVPPCTSGGAPVAAHHTRSTP